MRSRSATWARRSTSPWARRRWTFERRTCSCWIVATPMISEKSPPETQTQGERGTSQLSRASVARRTASQRAAVCGFPTLQRAAAA